MGGGVHQCGSQVERRTNDQGGFTVDALHRQSAAAMKLRQGKDGKTGVLDSIRAYPYIKKLT